MNNRLIPKKALQRAIDNGWDGAHYFVMGSRARELKDYEIWNHYSRNDIIFNHDFAKALWGDTTDYTAIAMPYPNTPKYAYLYQNGYKYHLQQMVIVDDPIKYLGEHLND